MVKSATKAPEIKQPFGCSIKGDTHAVQQIDDRWRGLTHGFDRRLIGQEVATVDSVVKVLPRGVAFALHVFSGIDATLSANRMRALDRHNGEQVNVAACFGDLDGRRQARQPTANYDDP